MSNNILYGVGNAILRDFTDLSKIIALTKLKNLSIDTSSNEEKIYAGDDPYPWASFPKDKAIKITADNVSFDMKVLSATQGVDYVTGVSTMTEISNIIIPEDGIVMLGYVPNDGTLSIDDYVSVADIASVATGKYFQDTTDKKKLIFSVDDKGKEITIIYERPTGDNAQIMSIMKESLSKPFKFIHRIPIYDNNNKIVGNAQLTIYKCRSNNAFTFNYQQYTAFAPKIEFEALNPQRPDGKLWDFVIEML